MIFNNHYLLCHSRDSVDAFFMRLKLFLLPQQLIGWFLGEELDGYPLVVHCNLGLTAHVCSGHGVADTPRTILIFLDCVHKLMSSLNINLSSFDNFLQNLGVFSC